MKEAPAQRDVEFLYEVGNMRHTPRMWTTVQGWKGYANLAEHTLRVMWIAVMLAERGGKPYDLGRLLMCAMSHDLGELRTGDMALLMKRYAQQDEKLALADILAGTSLQKTAEAALHDYKQRTSLESQYVKDADTLDCDLEIMEQSERGLQMPEMVAMRKQVIGTKLYTEVAKEVFGKIHATPARQWLVRLMEEFEGRQSVDPAVKLRA